MQKRKGISLIVLVITIIVMIILATAIIITLSNNGIITKANEAVDKTNDAQVNQIAQLAWAEAYADGVRTVEDAADGTKGFKTRIEEALEKNGLDSDDYGMVVTTSGVTIAKGWLKDGFTLKKGDQVLEIGDVVNYDAGVSTYTSGWKVLGADDNGNLLIMSSGAVKQNYQAYKGPNEDWYNGTDYLTSFYVAQEEWKNLVSVLNAECEPYGKGRGAISVRSITQEDVNAVTGYDPTTFGKGTIYEYGNTVTYSYNGTAKPAYTGSNGVSGTLRKGVYKLLFIQRRRFCYSNRFNNRNKWNCICNNNK